MPRKLPFDVVVGSLRQLVEGMVTGEELVLTVQGEPKAVVTKPMRTSWRCSARHGQGHEALDGLRLRHPARRHRGDRMTPLLDTHAFLWFWWAGPRPARRLSAAAQ
jgi:hypothetical protein